MFLASQHYSPLTVLLAGILNFAGTLGLGIGLLHFLRIKLPAPWQQAVGVLLGIQISSLLVQGFAMGGVASASALIGLWTIITAAGLYALSRWAQPAIQDERTVFSSFSLIWLTATVAGLGANLLAAVAPSTKIDEIFYHMLLPARIVTDQALRFYPYPFEGAILPQMTFQISTAPLHALGVPDAANVMSWCISCTLLWFVWHQLRERHSGWAYVATAAIVTGLYAVVWHVTAGAHAMGDLATVVAIVATLTSDTLILKVSPRSYAVLVAAATMGMAASKISLAPLAAFIGIWSLLVAAPAGVNRRTALLTLLATWAICLLPITIWTFRHSGSPFGPILAGAFGSSAYDLDAVRRVIAGDKLANQIIDHNTVLLLLEQYSPLVWIGVAAFFFQTRIPRSKRLLGGGLLLAQAIIIAYALPYEARFLGGLHYALGIACLLAVPDIQLRPAINWLALVLVAPWFAGQIYYASQFAGVSLGLSPPRDFYGTHVALYRDYEALNALLPKDAVLWILGRTSVAYAPRPAYVWPQKVSSGENVFVLAAEPTGSDCSHLQYGSVVYRNPSAFVTVYRTPGRAPQMGTVCVEKLR